VPPRRYLDLVDVRQNRLVHVVWELTLACDLKCNHCGSRAGRRRPGELMTEESLEVVGQLADMGTREVTLIGGEAYLRRDWITIVEAIRSAGMSCTLQTGGRGMTAERVRRLSDAGLDACGVSVDGLQEVHDQLRGIDGSYAAAMSALDLLRVAGIRTSANTQINALVLPDLPELFERLLQVGVSNWQVQLTVPMGRAADNSEILLQPYQMLELMPLLARLHQEGTTRGMLLQPGNNIGYFGPYESIIRGGGNELVHWAGCFAGRTVLGIESDGTIKGCPSLPTREYSAGNVKTESISELWASNPILTMNRPGQSRHETWGFCSGCYYADVCRGGCTWTAHSLLGRPGNNPFCHYRALELEKQGRRERIVKTAEAPGRSFDAGLFDIVLEEHCDPGHDGEWRTVTGKQLGKGGNDFSDRSRTIEDRQSPAGALELCRNCQCYVYEGTSTCPHCQSDTAEAARLYRDLLTTARDLKDQLARSLETMMKDSHRDNQVG
jgi:radical SAM protein with 4Fe4S-binding SPASM domain